MAWPAGIARVLSMAGFLLSRAVPKLVINFVQQNPQSTWFRVGNAVTEGMTQLSAPSVAAKMRRSSTLDMTTHR